MDTGQFLQYWFTNLGTFIGFLGASAALLFGVLIFVEFIKEKKKVTGEGDTDLSAIGESLKKLVENAQAGGVASSLTNAGAGSGEPIEGGASSEEVAKLQALLAEKDELITKLESSGGEGSGEDAGQLEELQNKLRDLEARLAEYEIIEDDIADLSMYKEENVRLKEELDKLKAGGAPPPAAAPTSMEAESKSDSGDASAPVEKSEDEDIMAEFAAAVKNSQDGEGEKETLSSETDEESVDAATTEPKAEGSPSNDDDIMAEFAAAVDDQEAPEPKEETGDESGADVVDELFGMMDSGDSGAADIESATDELVDGELSLGLSESETLEVPKAATADVSESNDSSASEVGSIDDAVGALSALEENGEETTATPEEEEDNSSVADVLSNDPVLQAAAELDLDGLSPDTDKMLGELEDLNQVAAMGDEIDGSDVLEEGVDTDKMLSEVDDLNAAAPSENDQKDLVKQFDKVVEE